MAKSIYSTELETLTALLREARVAAKLTQVDLSVRLGRPQSFVSKYESGQRRIDLVELAEICLELDVPLVEFVARFDSAITDDPQRRRTIRTRDATRTRR